MSRRRNLEMMCKSGFVYPEYDKSIYTYYGLLQGYEDTEMTIVKYVFAVSDIKKKLTNSSSEWRLSNGWSPLIIWYSYDGITWIQAFSGKANVMNIPLKSTWNGTIPCNILDGDIIQQEA